jgi:hypothetical protein
MMVRCELANKCTNDVCNHFCPHDHEGDECEDQKCHWTKLIVHCVEDK